MNNARHEKLNLQRFQNLLKLTRAIPQSIVIPRFALGYGQQPLFAARLAPVFICRAPSFVCNGHGLMRSCLLTAFLPFILFYFSCSCYFADSPCLVVLVLSNQPQYTWNLSVMPTSSSYLMTTGSCFLGKQGVCLLIGRNSLPTSVRIKGLV